MERVFNCIAFQHDPWLLGFSVVLACVGSLSAMLILRHARATDGRQGFWIATAAGAGAAGTWTTHFVAMLGYRSGADPEYALAPTILSFLIALAVMFAAFAVTVRIAQTWAPPVGGALLGLGIVAMHYTGMDAVDWGVPVTWRPQHVVASVALAVIFGAAALTVAVRGGRSGTPLATALMVLSIAGLHFTAMAAVSLTVDPGLPLHLAVPPRWLAVEVASLGILVMASALTGLWLHLRERQRARAEADRIRNFADLALEGLMIVGDTRIVAVNRSLARLLGCAESEIVGSHVNVFVPDEIVERLDSAAEGTPVEHDLLTPDGAAVPVEVAARSTDYCGREHRVIAFRDLRARREAEEKIRFLAYNDPLTGLANRENFGRQLEQALAASQRTGDVIAVLALDLDKFKAVNDSLGHQMGDRVLQTAGGRIRSTTRSSDTVARLGGDEFAIMQVGRPQPQAAETLARRLVEILSRPILLDGHIVSIGASVGIAISGEDGVSASELRKSADLALYRAKDLGRGTFAFFEPDMDAAMRDRRSLENDLRLAMARSAFSLAYQPLYEAGSKRLTGFEALLRWTHPRRGSIPPSTFIPLAEQSGLIIPIGKWVLRQACADAATWPDHLTVAVNLSAAQFADHKLVSTIRDALDRSALAPGRLEVEITEGVLLNNSNEVLECLAEIRKLGVSVAMDDFGTGYSSLSYLRAFPFDRVKIDRSFVKDMETNADSAAIVRAIIGLGHSLGMVTTAEGIENAEQLARIEAEGCDHLQGFYFSKPITLEEVGTVLERERNRVA